MIAKSFKTWVACGLFALSGCKQPSIESGGAESPESAAKPVAVTEERGPVKMTVSVDKGEITLAERLKLTVEVVAEDGVTIEMPRFGDRITDFAIRDFREITGEPTGDGKKRWRQMYDLDVFLSGDYTVPELTAMFSDKRDPDAPVEGGVTTDELKVTVTSLAEGEFDPAAFKDVKGPVEIPVDRTYAWAWWTAGGLVAAAAIVTLIAALVRRSRRAAPEIIVAAHEWAFDQLRMLIDDKLVEQGMVHEFYFRLSMIVREYIERRFGLMAPERTTEEFLVEVQRNRRLPAEFRDMLGEFLMSCDMVKFALYEPGAAEIERAFNAARDFVDRTAEREAPRRAAAA